MSDLPTVKEPGRNVAPSVPVSDLGRPRADDPGARTVHAESQAPTFTVTVGQSFGEYELLTEIARGGMGVVYRARQTALDRVVALKMILAGRLANSEDVTRFQTEAAAAAKLQHPNIVAVFDVGVQQGQHFFTMEYIEGISLDQKLAQGPLACKVAARYVRILARAVHYAHEHGILHRDLKPSNILMDVSDEPHITDFGLAKRLGPDNSGQTRSGAILGTPSYMSPEQAQGKVNLFGPACDVYSLGAILYELLTSRPPFCAETPLDTVMQVIDHDPVPPRLLNPNIDHDIETICLKCLEKAPEARYVSAEELGEDLQRYLNGDSITARSFNMLDRLARTLERDTHTADFAAWSSMLLVMAVVVFAEHVAVFGMVWFGQSRALILTARFTQFVLLAFLFWNNRGSRLLPTNVAERELWTIWIGYFASYFFAIVTTRLLTNRDVINTAMVADQYLAELLPYPFIALLSGLCFFTMGANYWGRCYAVGVVFLLTAPVMALNLNFGPLIFGVLWSIVLTMLGLHLRNQGLRKEAEQSAAQPSQAATLKFIVKK